MSELLSIIDAGSTEHVMTETNHYHWQFPIEGAWNGEEPLKLQKLMMPRPQLRISSSMESPEMSLVIGVLGGDRGTLQTRIADLLWWTDPDRGEFILKRTSSNSTDRRRTLTRTGYDIGRDALASGGYVVPVTITCQSADPTWYDPSPLLVSGQFNGATPVALAIANSNVATFIDTLIFSGEVNTPKVAIDDWELEFDTGGVMGATDMLTLVFDPGSSSFGATLLRSGAESSWSGRISAVSRWGQVPAGTSNATFSAASGDAMISLQLTKRYKVIS